MVLPLKTDCVLTYLCVLLVVGIYRCLGSLVSFLELWRTLHKVVGKRMNDPDGLEEGDGSGFIHMHQLPVWSQGSGPW